MLDRRAVMKSEGQNLVKAKLKCTAVPKPHEHFIYFTLQEDSLSFTHIIPEHHGNNWREETTNRTSLIRNE